MCPLCGCETSAYPTQVRASPAHQAPSIPPGLAARNRAWLTEQGIVALSFSGAPGSGMTMLLDSTAGRLQDCLDVRVVQSDPVASDTLTHTAPSSCSLLLVENEPFAGSAPDLGEQAKVVVASLLEGDDKPLKYPHVLRGAQALVLTKLDLLGLVDFNVDAYLQRALTINSRLQVFGLSARTGAGMDGWCNWLLRMAKAPVRKARPSYHEEGLTLRRTARRGAGNLACPG